jgi:hypothetical protein
MSIHGTAVVYFEDGVRKILFLDSITFGDSTQDVGATLTVLELAMHRLKEKLPFVHTITMQVL